MRALRREVPLLLLLLYGGAFAGAAFGRGVPAFDDHPGQLFRLWHALARSLPSITWTSDWNPDWWGGYPELQFYPPGFALLGAALRVVLLWQPSVETVYRLLCGVVFLAPGVTTYVLLARVVGDRWLALPPAFLALVLSADLRGGVEAGLRWGMLTTRLGLAWLPLLALALRPWVEGGRLPRWAPPLAALALLSHPSTLPSVVALLGLATALSLLARPDRRTVAAGRRHGRLRPAPDGLLESAVRGASSLGDPAGLGRPFARAPRRRRGAAGAPGAGHGRPVRLGRRRDSPATVRRPPRRAATPPGGTPPRRRLALPARVVRGRARSAPRRSRPGLCVGRGPRRSASSSARLVLPRANPRSRPLVALVAIVLAAILPDRGARPPTARHLARSGRMAHAGGSDAAPRPRPSLERASRRHGPRPLSHLVAQARRRPGVVRAPQPRVEPGASPGRARDRAWHVHAPLAARRTLLHRPGRAAGPPPDADRAPRRSAPPRRAMGAPAGSDLRPVRAAPPHRHRRRADR